MRELRWTINYSVNNEESLEAGERHEHGWIDSEGTEWALGDQGSAYGRAGGHHPDVRERAEAREFGHTGSLRDLLREADDYDCLEKHPEYDCLHTPNRPWSDSLADFQLYIEGVTEATKKRIYRLAEST